MKTQQSCIKTLLSHKISKEAFEEVAKVMEFGNITHPGELWVNEDPHIHLIHTRYHLIDWEYIPGGKIDKDSNLNALAHATARCLMALTLALKEDK